MPIFGRPKYDVVVVAMRLEKEGRIAWLRAFERRGPTWSDYRMIDRAAAIERIRAGERFVTGERIPYEAGTFKTFDALHVDERNGHPVLVAGDAGGEGDSLAGVPIL